MSLASLLDQVVAADVAIVAATREPKSGDLTASRYGCGAPDERARRACSLYLSLLGPTTSQLGVACPCRN